MSTTNPLKLDDDLVAGFIELGLITQLTNVQSGLKSIEDNEFTETTIQNVIGGIFKHLSKDPHFIQKYLPLLRELARTNGGVYRLLTKSITKKGRCPKQVLPNIRTLLSELQDEKAFEAERLA